MVWFTSMLKIYPFIICRIFEIRSRLLTLPAHYAFSKIQIHISETNKNDKISGAKTEYKNRMFTI